jgi:hypothetical protein
MKALTSIVALVVTAFMLTGCCCDTNPCCPPRPCPPRPCCEAKPRCCPKPHYWCSCPCDPSNYPYEYTIPNYYYLPFHYTGR